MTASIILQTTLVNYFLESLISIVTKNLLCGAGPLALFVYANVTTTNNIYDITH